MLLELTAATAILAFGGAAIAARLSGRGLIERTLALIVGALSELIVCLLVAGMGGFLNPPGVALSYLVASSILVCLVAGPRRTWAWMKTLARDAGRAIGDGKRVLRRPWIAVLAAVSAVELVWRGVLAYALPLTGSDALHYHLTTVAWWLQTAGFSENPFTAESRGYPSGTELVFAHVALFAHRIEVVNLVQIGFALLGALATAGLARVFGARRGTSAVAGMLFFLTPVVLAQSAIAYVDIAAASEFTASLYFISRYLRGSEETSSGADRKNVLLAGLAGGLALGSKPSAPLWISAVIFALVVFSFFARTRYAVPLRRSAGTLAVFVAAVMIVGGYWYVRNSVVYHDPVYPASVVVHSRTLFRGAAGMEQLVESPPGRAPRFPLSIAHSWAHDLVPFLTTERFYRYDQRSGGLGPVWIYILLPALGLSVLRLAKKRDVAVIGILATVTLAWLASPYAWWSRFSLFLVSIGAAAAAVQIDRLWPLRRAKLLAWGMVATVLLGVCMATWEYQLGDGRSIDTVAAARLVAAGQAERTLDIGGFEVAQRAPAGSVVAVDPNDVTILFPVWGLRFERKVVAVDLDAAGAWDRLRRSGAEYVFVASERAARRVSLLRPGSTRLVAAKKGFRIFRIRPAAST